MSGVEDLQEVKRFRAADFPHNNSVCGKSEGMLDEIPDRNLLAAIARWLRLAPYDVRLIDLDFAYILNQDNAVRWWNESAQRSEHGSFSSAGSTADQNCISRLNAMA